LQTELYKASVGPNREMIFITKRLCNFLTYCALKWPNPVVVGVLLLFFPWIR